MDNLKEVLKSAIEDGDVQGKVEDATGTYEDKVAAELDTMSKLPYSSLPQAPDASPFTVGPLGSK
jgi:hypothetical protein